MEPVLRIVCWGTRGSIPSPGPDTVRYGGNTPCVQVSTPGGTLILDGGTGIRRLGRALLSTADAGVDATLLLTHFHWDHVQGIPFFEPLYDAATRLRILSPRRASPDAARLFERLTEYAFFPAPREAIAAGLEFGAVDEPTELAGGVRLTTFPVRHASGAVGYRVRCGEATLCYLPDNELVGGAYDVSTDWRARLVELLGDADLLLHDATYTDSEYEAHAGWGHSTASQAVELAEEAGVRRLLLFHHAPERTDDEMDRIVSDIRSRLASRGSPLLVDAAAEGDLLAVDG